MTARRITFRSGETYDIRVLRPAGRVFSITGRSDAGGVFSCGRENTAYLALNPHKGTATNAMVLFLAINTSSVTLLPTGVIVWRETLGSARAADITPVGLTFSADGRRAFVGLGRANHVAFVDVGTRKVTDLVLVGQRAWSVALDKSQKTLAVVNGLSDDLTLVDVGSAKALKTIKVGRVPHTVVIVE